MIFDEELLRYMLHNLKTESPHHLMDILVDNIGRGGLSWYIYLIVSFGVLMLLIVISVIAHRTKHKYGYTKTGRRVKRTYLI